MKRSFVIACVLFGVVLAGPLAAATREVVAVDGEQAVIARDDYGVPHIIAPTMRALFFANGWAVAEDRLLQIEKYRRGARGTAAAVLGEKFVEQDKSVRLTGYTEQELQAQAEAMPLEFQQIVQAYADGINAYFAKARDAGTLPSEFKLAQMAGMQWEPFKPSDTVAIGAMMARRFGSGGGTELMVAAMFEKLKARYGKRARAIFDDVAWMNDPAAPVTIPPGEGKGAMVFGQAGRENVERLAGLLDPRVMEAAYKVVNWGRPEWRAALGLPSKVGSYCVVAAPKRSASKCAMLLGGPQMGFSVPQISHEVHLMGPGLNVMGMGFAGVPGVLIGMNENLAWTTTSAGADVEDIFVEKLNPANQYQYWHKGAWRDMERRVERIEVRGAQPVEFEVFRTVHGPVIKWDKDKGVAYAHAMNYWKRETQTIRAMAGFWRARNVTEFARAASYITTTHNFFCATKQGDIGFWYCCKYPVRTGKIDRRFPVPGTGEYDWKGDVPFEKMPQIVNPKQGYLANWNNKPAVWWEPGDVSGWGEIFHLSSIIRAVQKRPVMTFTEFEELQKDYGRRVFFADYFLPYVFKAAERTGAWKDARLGVALRQLQAWDRYLTDMSVPAAIFTAWLEQVKHLLFADQFGDLYPQLFGGTLQERGASVLLRVFEGKKAGLPLKYDYLHGRNMDAVIIKALSQGLDQLTKKYGTKQMNRWFERDQKVNFEGLGWIPWYSRGTYIQVVECSSPEISGVNIVAPGQSEDPKSPHYGDQRELAGYWMFKPMVLSRAAWEK